MEPVVHAINHHLPAIYVVIALIVVPVVAILLVRFFAKRKARQVREAMLRGNRLHRNWLEQSKQELER